MRQDVSPFRIGTEYYRAPMPPEKFWQEDFAAIRKVGMSIVRMFVYWNWLEPRQGIYEFEDIDRMFEVARKNKLSVEFSLTLATHGACPGWMLRDYPDIRIVGSDGKIALPHAGPATPQGSMIHCFDHPKWKEFGAKLIQAIVTRYKDVPNLAYYNVWDAIARPPCYCKYTISRYKDWLKQNFSIEQLNEMWCTRYRCWEDIEPPRSVDDISGMLLWRLFLKIDLAKTLKWQVDIIRSIDKKHEIIAHTCYQRGPGTGSILDACASDERNAKLLDSWGIALASSPFYSSGRLLFCEHSLALDWQRSVSKDGQFWIDELYSGMNTEGMKWAKQTEPEQLVLDLWLHLATGAKGTIFWQYRPEYKSFEAPGFTLVSPDGSPTDRLSAVSDTIKDIGSIEKHLPLVIPRAEVALVYHEDSHMMFDLGNNVREYGDNIFGVYRALWEHNIPVDIIAPSMDWRKYKVIYLSNTVLLDEQLIKKITQTIEKERQTYIVADGLFGSYNSTGRFSYSPPEGLSEFLGVRVLDYFLSTEREIGGEIGTLTTEFGELNMPAGRRCALLSSFGSIETIANFDSKVVGIQTKDRKFTWFSFPLAQERSQDLQKLIIRLVTSFGIKEPVKSQGDRVAIRCGRSKIGGWLVFVFNLEEKSASVQLEPSWEFSKAQDLLMEQILVVEEHRFRVNVKSGTVKVIHCQ